MSRIRPSAPPEPASAIARALHRRLPDRIQGAGTLYLWLRRGRTALRVARRLTAIGWEHEFVDACARIPLGNGDVQVSTAELCSALSEAEAVDTRALFVPGDGPSMCVFINFSPPPIRDPEAHLNATVQAIEEVELPRERVVFEVTEADRYGDTPLLEIGHGMRVGTSVEGIEEEAELSWVRENGADFVQGFLLGRPSPVVRS